MHNAVARGGVREVLTHRMCAACAPRVCCVLRSPPQMSTWLRTATHLVQVLPHWKLVAQCRRRNLCPLGTRRAPG